MLSRDRIIEIFGKENISCYETEYCYDNDLDITLKSGDIHELIRIIRENNIKSVFYAFNIPNKNDFIISITDKHEPNKYSDEVLYRKYEEVFEQKMDSWNAQFKKYHFSKPIELHVFCYLDGMEIGIKQSNPWTNTLHEKYEELDMLGNWFKNLCVNQVEQESKAEEQKKERVLNEILEYWRQNQDWHIYTNQTLRRKYCADLAKEYSERYNVTISSHDIYSDFEMMWLKYKEGLK